MTFEELMAIVESTARTVQGIAAQQGEFRRDLAEQHLAFRQELEEHRLEFRQELGEYERLNRQRHDDLSAELQAISRDVSRLVDTQQAAATERQELREATLGIANLLSCLDEDRPTILRKLNTIENKVDSLISTLEKP